MSSYEELRHKQNQLELTVENLANSMHELANSFSATNRKMEDFTTMIGQQNLLMEKFTNMDVNFKEFAGRLYERLEKVESQQSDGGCSALKQLGKDKDLYDEKLSVANHRLEDLENSNKWLVRTIGAMLLAGVAKVVFDVG